MLRDRARIALIFAALTLLMPLAASAATGLKIQPVKISETLSPGGSTSGTIYLTNVSDTPVDVSVSLQDFVPLAGADTIQFVGRTEGVTSVRDWITVDGPTSFHLAKDEAKNIGYTIKAPANAEPGGHFGAVFFKAVVPGPSTLKVGTQVGMLVLVAIPGSHTEKGRIFDFTTKHFIQRPPVSFNFSFENTGTVHFEPRGQIVITDMLGRVAGTVPIQGEVVLPTTIKKMQFDWNVSGFLIGRYTAVATVVDGEGNALTSDSVSFWIVPVWYIVAFVVILILIFLMIRFLKRRVRITFASK